VTNISNAHRNNGQHMHPAQTEPRY